MIDRLPPRLRCSIKGHRKTWTHGFFGPTWTCEVCGGSGDLESHSRLSLFEHAVHIVVAIVVVLIIRWIVISVF